MSYHGERKGEGAGAIAAMSTPHRSAPAPIATRSQTVQYTVGDQLRPVMPVGARGRRRRRALGDDLGSGVICGYAPDGRPLTATSFDQCPPTGPGRPMQTTRPGGISGPRKFTQKSGTFGSSTQPNKGTVFGTGTHGTGPTFGSGPFHPRPQPGSGSSSGSSGSGSSSGTPGGETSGTQPSSSSISSTSAPPQVITGGMVCPDGTTVTSIDQCSSGSGSPSDYDIDLSYLDSTSAPDTSSPDGTTTVVAVSTPQQVAATPKKFPWLLVGGGIALLYALSRK